MPTTNAPWKAAHAGVLGQADAIEGSGQLNQLLTTHPGNRIYQGNAILSPAGLGGTDWVQPLTGLDVAQPFTMSGSSIGRVVIPVLPCGTGADLIVSLCNDNSGAPGTVITRTRVSASWINQLSAVIGIGSSSTTPANLATQYTGSPVAVAQSNTLHSVSPTIIDWSLPAVTGGPASFPSTTTYGNYFIQLGGYDNTFTNLSSVYTIAFDGAGNLSQAVPQPSMPTTMSSGACVVSTDTNGDATLVVTGGTQTNGGSAIATVYTAGFNASTGVVGAWSSQTSLPTAVFSHAMAAANGYVYAIGGATGSGAGTPVSGVAYASVTNGQITAWNSTTSLPANLILTYAAAIDGFVIVAGGSTGGAGLSSVYYAPILPNGSLGTWQTGPTLPSGASSSSNQQLLTAGSYGVLLPNTSTVYELGVTSNGPGSPWVSVSVNTFNYAALAARGAGSWQFYGLSTGGSYETFTVSLTPSISVPLPASGLSNGTKYHIVMQQPTADLNNYNRLSYDSFAFPGNPTFLYSNAGTWTWTAFSPSATCIPITIYDNSDNVSGPNGNNQLLHTWDDNGARITTQIQATTPDRRLLGLLEATCSPTALNANSGFETGVSPWTASNGTISQSSAQAYEGQFSLLLTPTGGFTTAAALSEKVRCVPGVSYTVNAWAYSPGGYSNTDIQVNWYNSSGTFLSSSSTAFNIPSATWTNITAAFTAPLNATQAQIVLQEAGSPTSGNTIYFDNAWIYETSGGPQVSSVLAYGWAGTWPGTKLWPPTGTTELA